MKKKLLLLSVLSIFFVQMGMTQLWEPSGVSGSTANIWRDGKVGIGTNNPWSGAKLTVENVIATKPSGVDGYYSYLKSIWSVNNAFELGISDGSNWHKLITSSNYHYGSTLQFWTSDTEKMRITSSGNVGIGTSTPDDTKLHVMKGEASASPFSVTTAVLENSTTNILQFLNPNTSVAGIMFGDGGHPYSGYIRYSHADNDMQFWTNAQKRMSIDVNGNVGIGSTSPTLGKLQINQSINSNAGGLTIVDSDVTRSFRLFIDGTNAILNGNSGGTIPIILNQGGGNVGIGRTPSHTLDVAGTIRAQEVIVEIAAPAPDYVFEEDYNLRTLSEVESFVKENKHLPDVPTGESMEQNGIGVAEMNMLLLKKMEEMTLYMINQQKEIDALKVEVKDLKKK